MAMLASKSAYPAPHSASTQPSSAQYSSVANYRIHSSTGKESNGFFASPTESEFSEHYDGAPDSIKYAFLVPGDDCCAKYLLLGIGMKTLLPNGFVA